ncbi:hypothetical protein O181_061215, partial [Austropuccinia psidii MF-1]|nr:hypothetical protein [Austropuccinia psidii MF-1]
RWHQQQLTVHRFCHEKIELGPRTAPCKSSSSKDEIFRCGVRHSSREGVRPCQTYERWLVEPTQLLWPSPRRACVGVGTYLRGGRCNNLTCLEYFNTGCQTCSPSGVKKKEREGLFGPEREVFIGIACLLSGRTFKRKLIGLKQPTTGGL